MARRSTLTGDAIRDNTLTGDDVDEGSLRYPMRDVDASVALLDSDYIVRCVQGSSITLTLPAKSSSLGQILIIKDALGNAASNNITLDGNGDERIDGQTTYTISRNGESVVIVCDGVNGWMIISRIRP